MKVKHRIMSAIITAISIFLVNVYAYADADAKLLSPKNPIPKRSSQASPKLIDLSAHYNASLDDDWLVKKGANLSPLPKGLQTFANVDFDIRGVVQLAGISAIKATGIDLPQTIKGIKVGAKIRKFHFLQGAAWGTKDDVKIGEYVLHYQNGQLATIPIIYQRHTRDWFIQKGNQLPTDADVAWSGENEASHKLGYTIELYKNTAYNPFPDLRIETIDFISTLSESAPFIVAITVEPIDPIADSNASKVTDKPSTENIAMKTKTIDLAKYYNSFLDENIHDKPGNDLKTVPHGRSDWAGTPFDVGGFIQLSGKISKEKAGIDYPNKINGIPINQKADKLQFLHCASWHDKAGTKIGEYRIHYKNKHSEIIPIVYQMDVVDWWFTPEDVSPTESKIAWRGGNERTRGRGYSIQLYQSTWVNPFPEIEIATMDFISDGKDSAPFLMALTTESSK